MDKKFTDYGQIDTVAQGDILPIVDISDTTQSAQGSSKYATVTQVLALASATSNPAVENSYLTVAAMIADQGNQTAGNFQYVADASADPEITSGDAYYNYLGTTDGDLDDYNLLNDGEVVTLNDGIHTFGIAEINDPASDSVTSLSNVNLEYDGVDITAIVFNANYSEFLVAVQTAVNAGSTFKVRIFNKVTREQFILDLDSLDWTDGTYTYMKVFVGTGMDTDDVATHHKVEIYFDYYEASTTVYTTNIFDFLTDATTKAKVLANDDTQDSAVVKTAFDAAFSYCSSNGIKKLFIPSGTYVVDKCTVTGIDNFVLEGDGAIMMPGTGNAIFEFTTCEDWEIRGFHFTSDAVAYADVAFLRVSTNSGFFNIHNCKFSNMPRCGIRANSLVGGTFTYGIQVHDCLFLDTSNYSNDNQCGIELAGDGEYSKVHHNIFQGIPSAIRMVDGANSEFSFNTCMEMNGDAYDASYTNGIVFCNQVSNSGKIDILYNKINHNDTGMVAIVCKGDATKPQNPFKVIGNDILVNNSGTKTQAIYFKDAPNSICKDNKMRGNSASPNDTAIVVEDSDFLILDGNYLNYYANGVELITSNQVKIGNQNIFENISTDKFVVDSGSIDVDCETFAFAISGYGSDVSVADTSPKWMPYDCWLVNYWISAGVAPTGSALSVGFELNDADQVSVDASIDATENTSLTGTNPTLSTNDLIVGDKVMFPITAIGSTTAGQDVTVYMKVIRV